MTPLLKQAAEEAQRLPPDEQDALAHRILEELARIEAEALRADIADAENELARGEGMTHEEAKARIMSRLRSNG